MKGDVKMEKKFNLFIPYVNNPITREIVFWLEQSAPERILNKVAQQNWSFMEALSREEKIFCLVLQGLSMAEEGHRAPEGLRERYFESALECLGRAYGLAVSDQRLKIELMIAYVNYLEENYKESRRGAGSVNNALVKKSCTNNNQSVTYLLEEASMLFGLLESKPNTNRPIQRTNRFLTVQMS